MSPTPPNSPALLSPPVPFPTPYVVSFIPQLSFLRHQQNAALSLQPNILSSTAALQPQCYRHLQTTAIVPQQTELLPTLYTTAIPPPPPPALLQLHRHPSSTSDDADNSEEDDMTDEMTTNENSDEDNRSCDVSSSPCRDGGNRKKKRTAFTTIQLQELESKFNEQKYLTKVDRTCLAKRLGLTEKHVKTWYQNRRTKWKRSTTEMEWSHERERSATVMYQQFVTQKNSLSHNDFHT